MKLLIIDTSSRSVTYNGIEYYTLFQQLNLSATMNKARYDSDDGYADDIKILKHFKREGFTHVSEIDVCFSYGMDELPIDHAIQRVRNFMVANAKRNVEKLYEMLC